MRRILLAVAAVLSTGLSWARSENLSVSNGGGFSFVRHPDNRFEPLLFDGNWGRCRTSGGWNDEAKESRTRAFQIIGRDDAPLVRGKVTYSHRADASVARFVWDFTAVKDFDGQTFCIS